MADAHESLNQFRKNFADVEGFSWPQSEAVWSFLLTTQNESKIAGNHLEIGVFKGRSAHLAALFLADDEVSILVDHNDISAVGARMAEYGRKPLIIQRSSDELERTDAVAYRGTCRLVHVDGDHTGQAVLGDLDLARDYLVPSGMIVVDDFYNAQYPQITAVTYKWLDLNPGFRMVLCGFNKAYLVRTRAYDLYESVIRRYLADYLQNQDEDASVAKTGPAHDFGCWGVVKRGDRLIVGNDQQPDLLPY